MRKHTGKVLDDAAVKVSDPSQLYSILVVSHMKYRHVPVHHCDLDSESLTVTRALLV